MEQPEAGEEEEEEAVGIWDCGSPLYDSYELVSLSHLIERNLMVFPFSVGSGKGNDRFSNVFDSIPVSILRSDDNPPIKKTKTKRLMSLGASLGVFVGASKVWKGRVTGERKVKGKKKMSIALLGCPTSLVLWKRQI